MTKNNSANDKYGARGDDVKFIGKTMRRRPGSAKATAADAMRSASMSIAVLAIASAATATRAQATVNIYGIIDQPVEYLNGVGAARASVTRLPGVLGSVASRLGFRGTEDLGGGLSAMFNLEMGIAPDTGSLNQGGRAFGRQSIVGLTGPWGTVMLGRQYTMTYFATGEAHVLTPSLYGDASLDTYLGSARADNALGYRVNVGNLFFGATYSLGRDSINCAGENAADTKACREWSAVARYDTPAGGATLGYDTFNGRSPAAPADVVAGGLNTSSRHDSRLLVNGYVRLAGVKVGLGLVRRDNDGDPGKPRSNLWQMSGSYPVTSQVTVDAQVATLRYQNASPFNATVYVVRGIYAFSKRTLVYSELGHIRNNTNSAASISTGQGGGAPAPGGSQTGLAVGIRHSF